MTTTVTLAARDFIVVAADSLATASLDCIPSTAILNSFFEPGGAIKLDQQGKPLLASATQLINISQSLPVNQLPSVTKVFSLEPQKAALLFAGAMRIGDVSVKNIVAQFVVTPDFIACRTVEEIAEKLRDFIACIYNREIPNAEMRPTMEILLSGYSKDYWQPEIFRLTFAWDWSKQTFNVASGPEVTRGKYDVIFGGQYDVIQRVVNGIDINSWLNLKQRVREVLSNYKDKIEKDLAAHGHQLVVISPDPADADLDIFSKNWGGVTQIFANVSDLSEQAGIEFVQFLITTMIKAQEFSSSIPTVGGEIHIAVIAKNSGFQWVHKPYLERARDSTHH